MRRVLIIAGGTGGHIFPGLAIAQALQQQQINIYWLGSEIGLEREIVAPHYPFTCIAAKQVRGKSLFKKLTAPFFLLRATWQARKIIKKIQPDVVLAMGGFVSAPGGLAAKLTNTPLVLHEQNSIAGYTNRILAHVANLVLCAFPNTFPKKTKTIVVGNPIRASITALSATPKKPSENHFNLLILGGSQGAKAINELILDLLKYFPFLEKLNIWHQTGKIDYPNIEAQYNQFEKKAQINSIKITPFITDITPAYAWADLVICRSGALTVSELAAAGMPSILIPYPYAVDDHQWYNGLYLAEKNAAILIREANLTGEKLNSVVCELMRDRQQLTAMARAAQGLSKPEAINDIIKTLQGLVHSNSLQPVIKN